MIIDKLNEKMIEGVNQGVFPGVNYCYIEGDKSYYGSFGLKAMYPEKEENDIDTIYDIASLSKVVGTTMAILKLVEEKVIDLNDPIKNYLPYIKYNHITIKDLLIHASGYPALTQGTTEMTTAEPLMLDLENCELEYETGSKVVYSDVGFLYLGFLVNQLKGSMATYLKTTVFDPLQMYDTRYNHKEILRIAPTENFGFRGLIRGFVHDEKAFLLDGVAGHAGLYSTVKDLEKFVRMILNNGSFNNQKILSTESISTIETKVIESDDHFRSVGWIIKKINNHDVLYHTGYTGTHLLIDRKKQKGMIMLSNRVHPTRENTKIIQFRKEVEAIIYGDES